MEELAERLKKDGYEVVDMNLVPMACNLDLAKKPEYKSDVLIILACDAGVSLTKHFFLLNRLFQPAIHTVLVLEIAKAIFF